ncbi:Myc box-dependent-interacting protein 1 [Geodia barretti]|uniref:Myc box-dependent-interacting protein 1 n=1 Tax=Geodia barretti TaxID=519541 RepID=A0AA35R1X4_GEOBA|nr:Myc box-dependent-interacting protein 1 [Geodia barretti]
MAERHDGGGGGGGGKGGKILSMTVKRARRVQEKMMQKLGKSDQTRDDVFEEFVNNFNKQNACAVKLQKEMMKYMNSIRVLYQNTKSMSETVRELYEDDWEGCEKQRELMEQRILLWEDLLTSLSSRTVEPMSNYISRFSDVKIRIQKRERKMVDFDLRRRELEHAKSKAKVRDQKVQQAEETHTQAKQLFDEITDELYEELPTLYDSRIQFYAQIFQSIAAAEARFHAEITKIDEDLARVMDGLAAEAATGIHSTKKQRNTLSNTPKLMSRPVEEDSDDDSEGTESHTTSRSPSLKQSHLSPTPSEPNQNSIGEGK